MGTTQDKPNTCFRHLRISMDYTRSCWIAVDYARLYDITQLVFETSQYINRCRTGRHACCVSLQGLLESGLRERSSSSSQWWCFVWVPLLVYCYLSNAASFVMCCVWSCQGSSYVTLQQDSPRLKTTRVRQVVSDKWFPLK